MPNVNRSDLAKAIAAAYMVCSGRELRAELLKLYTEKLSHYPPDAVRAALNSCVNTMKGHLALSDVVKRVVAMDGRPDVETAWSMIPKNESQSCVWTDEMVQAWNVARGADENLISMRMAFKENYTELVEEARRQGRPVSWTFSPGTDVDGRGRALLEAVQAGRLKHGHAATLARLPEKPPRKALPAPRGECQDCGERSWVDMLAELRTKPKPSLDVCQARLEKLVRDAGIC